MSVGMSRAVVENLRVKLIDWLIVELDLVREATVRGERVKVAVTLFLAQDTWLVEVIVWILNGWVVVVVLEFLMFSNSN